MTSLSLALCAKRMVRCVCIESVGQSDWAARAILTSAPAAWVSAGWLIFAQGLRVWRSLAHLLSHTMRQRRRAARAGMWRKWMRGKERNSPCIICSAFPIWFSPRHTISLDPFKVRCRAKKNYVWQLTTIHAQSAHSEPIIWVHTALWWLVFALFVPRQWK